MATATRHLVAADAEAAAAVLADAFADDPMFSWAFTDAAARPEQLRRWMAVAVGCALARGHAYVAGGGGGVALWSPPDVAFFDDAAIGRLFEGVAEADPARLEEVAVGLSAVGALHPEGPPHFYLHAIGTTQAARGTGLGGALLQRVLATCDAEGLPAYLESSNPANVPLYERFGFAVTGEVEVEPGGPVLHTMWRDPTG